MYRDQALVHIANRLACHGVWPGTATFSPERQERSPHNERANSFLHSDNDWGSSWV